VTSEPTYALGIDLGTTNTALASAPMGDEAAPVAVELPQVVRRGEISARAMLPSCLYLPAPGELPEGAIALPWSPDVSYAVGGFAQEHGASTPSRLVSSAKSWLSYDGVDRRAPILPWQAPDDVPKLSPLEASARLLEHVVAAWDHAHPEARLAEQDVVLTVPASFDAVARELTVEAARRAGLGDHLRLLEEPQAALYAWAADRGAAWRDQVSVGDTILVVDIGGGTTDLSLIRVREEGGSLELERVAVGDHILLGGDNMDLALAWTVRVRLEKEGRKLDDWQMRALTHGCRQAKEAMLADPARDSWPLVIASRGSKLFGGTLRAELARAELESTLLDGFFPRVGPDARPQAPRRVGLTTLGLPYASDAAITRHLAAFLGRAASGEAGTSPHPTAVLFNGGVTRSPILRDRIVQILGDWATADGGPQPRVLVGGPHPRVLTTASPDVAVCRGAAYYAWARRHGGIRIRGGTARSYYVGVERAQLAVPGIPPQLDALCVAPFGMEEGSEVELPEPFGLVTGEPTSFRFFSSAERRDDPVGAVADPDALAELAPVEATLQGEGQGVVPVRLHARVTEVGTLELSAVEQASGRRWQLSFDVSVR
jgi:molecular chaperone DnaK (HSP70)